MFKFLQKKVKWNILDEKRNWIEATIPLWEALLDCIPLIGWGIFFGILYFMRG